jgi:hypothetical protein
VSPKILAEKGCFERIVYSIISIYAVSGEDSILNE